jgi:hypothetical protein
LSFPAIAQSPTPVTSSPNNPATDNVLRPNSLASPSVTLYSQYDNPGTSSYSSQNFEPAQDAYDDFLADDFVVPAGQNWNLNKLDVQGTYFSGVGPADSMNVFIYTEAITSPGTLLESRTAISYTNVADNFSIPISPTIVLNPGKYWVSVQANMDFSTNGQWGWTGRTVTSNYPATWQNPGDGFGICITWRERSFCTGGPEQPDQVFSLSGTNTFPQCGNPARWVVRKNLPVAVYGAAIANDGVYAYVLGGYSFLLTKDITDTVRYDPLANTWTSLAPTPHEVGLASAVYSPINNKLYVFGGEKIASAELFNTTLIYNIASNTWTNGAPMPDVRAFTAEGYYNGKIYVIGGYSTGSISPAFAQVWEYDVMADTWTTKTDMPDALGGAASAVVNGHLFVIGGRDADNNVLSQTYNYNITLDSWSVGANIPYGVNVPGEAVVGGKIWVIGGGTPFLGLDVSSTTMETNAPNFMGTTMIYDPATNLWVNGPSLNVPRSFVTATGFDNLAIAVGGYDGAGSSGITEVMGTCRAYMPLLKK